MLAVAAKHRAHVRYPDAFIDFDAPDPTPAGREAGRDRGRRAGWVKAALILAFALAVISGITYFVVDIRQENARQEARSERLAQKFAERDDERATELRETQRLASALCEESRSYDPNASEALRRRVWDDLAAKWDSRTRMYALREHCPAQLEPFAYQVTVRPDPPQRETRENHGYADDPLSILDGCEGNRQMFREYYEEGFYDQDDLDSSLAELESLGC